MNVEQIGTDIARRHFGSRCVARLEKRGIVVLGLQNRLRVQPLDAQTQYLVSENGHQRVWSATEIIAASYAAALIKMG